MGWISFQKKWLLLLLLVIFSVSTAIAFFIRSAFDSCDPRPEEQIRFKAPAGSFQNPLGFMRSKLVLLVSHELSLSGESLCSPFYFFYFLFMVNSWFYSVLVVTHMRKCQLWIIWVDKLVGLTCKWLWNEIGYTLRVEFAFIWRIRIAPDHDF